MKFGSGERRKLNNEELNDLYPLPNILRMVKSRRMRWARRAQVVGGGNLMDRGQWGDPGVDGRIVLRWILRMLEGVVRTGWSWLRIGTDGGHL
jgi:hypothetical protein